MPRPSDIVDLHCPGIDAFNFEEPLTSQGAGDLQPNLIPDPHVTGAIASLFFRHFVLLELAGKKTLPVSRGSRCSARGRCDFGALRSRAAAEIAQMMAFDVLIINLHDTHDFLKMIGFEVFEASTDSAACALLRQVTQIELMVLYYRLPDMKGDVVAAHCRQLRPDVRILLETGWLSVPELAGERVLMKPS